jgi:5-methylcytosine-specific restriction endonuclease McrA
MSTRVYTAKPQHALIHFVSAEHNHSLCGKEAIGWAEVPYTSLRWGWHGNGCMKCQSRYRTGDFKAGKTKRQNHIQRIYEALEGLVPCFCCGHPVPEADASLEHVVPLAWGGVNASWNLAISHTKCNTFRGSPEPGTELPQPFGLGGPVRPPVTSVKKPRPAGVSLKYKPFMRMEPPCTENVVRAWDDREDRELPKTPKSV